MYLPSLGRSKMMRGVCLLGVLTFVSIGYFGLPKNFEKYEDEPAEMRTKSLSDLENLANPTTENRAEDNARRYLKEYKESKGSSLSCTGDCAQKKERYLVSERELSVKSDQRRNARRAIKVREREAALAARQADQQQSKIDRRAARLAAVAEFQEQRQEQRRHQAALKAQAERDETVKNLSAKDRAAYFRRERFAFNKAQRDAKNSAPEAVQMALRDEFIAAQNERFSHLPDPIDRILARRAERAAINVRLSFEESIAHLSPKEKRAARKQHRNDYDTLTEENRQAMNDCEGYVANLVVALEVAEQAFTGASAAQAAAFAQYIEDFQNGDDEAGCMFWMCWDFTYDDIKFEKQDEMEDAEYALASQRYECETLAAEQGKTVHWTGSLHWFLEKDGLADEVNFTPAPTPSPFNDPNVPDFAGACGSGQRGDGVCANGRCCSQSGWCGTTDLHCSGDPLYSGNSL